MINRPRRGDLPCRLTLTAARLHPELSGFVPGEVFVLTMADFRLIFEALEAKHGRGYSNVPEVGRLQAKLSIMAEAASKRESRSDPICRDDIGDGSTVYDDRPRPGAVSG
jgi:hypothetical protein